MVQSLHDHKQEKLPSVATVADGIAVKEPGKITFETCSNYVDEIVTVSEDEICAAILKLIESEKMVAEGAGAASVAAVMYNKVPVKGKKTICVVSGGNIDVTILNRVINRGLVKSGRLCTIEMELDDKPGELVEVASVIASLGGNITGVHHDRSANRNKVNACVLRVTMETRDEDMSRREFLDAYYGAFDKDDPLVAEAESSDGVIAMLAKLRAMLTEAYPDCAPLRRLTGRIDTAVKMTSRSSVALPFQPKPSSRSRMMASSFWYLAKSAGVMVATCAAKDSSCSMSRRTSGSVWSARRRTRLRMVSRQAAGLENSAFSRVVRNSCSPPRRWSMRANCRPVKASNTCSSTGLAVQRAVRISRSLKAVLTWSWMSFLNRRMNSPLMSSGP